MNLASLEAFNFIIGEESLTDSFGVLHDKPDPYGQQLIRRIPEKQIRAYIGDNKLIDKEFAQNIGAPFIYADYKTDFASISLP